MSDQTGAPQSGGGSSSVVETDVVVIGGGPAGENAADRAVQGGLQAVLVEGELLGGECSYWACMPSKALLRDTQVLSEARALPGARAALSGQLDVAAVLARRTSFTSDWDDAGQVSWADGAGISVLRGHGRLSGEREVTVETAEGVRTLRARHAVVLATGSTAVVPGTFADVQPWTSREATSAKEPPASLVVVGGGVVACELALAWQGLGSTVTLLVRDQGLLGRLEPFAGELVLAGLREHGVDVRLGVSVESARREDGEVVLGLAGGGEVRAAEVLVATGRRPRTRDVGLESVGIDPEHAVEVDDTLRVPGSDWLYAVGDVNGRNLLTHMGKYQARACGDAIAARARGEQLTGERWARTSASADAAATPSVVFTVPEVASVGLTLAEAQSRGLRVRAVDYELGSVAGASLLADGYSGTARLVVDEDRRVVVGATFVGAGVAELLHSATVAVVGEVPLERLWHAVPSYPTMSEVWLRLLEAYGL
ncbi:dihydrolipoamide dehydrogenase [Motilibacter rhizosphaerae]|uniref:Dihydrolipoamide dehydrogenase n=1 Tax=Motilibacter rhizosphaerae TaxID=598652 RepID=A0A4Q7NVY9_9ACTN|nr:NAD(P)/FAD-dependent oxidoreductase [Motilibacter rhizosphaerae]RZS91367.1 dihydrolipoamide dehydrogenase [Motilibacter rhizosphaerae]